MPSDKSYRCLWGPYNDLISSHIPEKSDSSDVGTNSDYEESQKIIAIHIFLKSFLFIWLGQ